MGQAENLRYVTRTASFASESISYWSSSFSLTLPVTSPPSSLLAGIPLIAIDNPHPGAVYFGGDGYKAGHIAGTHLGRWAATHWQGLVDEVLLIGNSAGGPILDARLLGIRDGIAHMLPSVSERPHIRCDARRNQFNMTLDLVRKYLRRSRARKILVGTVNDPTALAALESFREFGAAECCAIVGQGAVSEARHEMRRPGTRLVGSVAYFPETYGERLMPLVRAVLARQPRLEAVFTHHRIVTPENVDKIYPNDLLLKVPPLTGRGVSPGVTALSGVRHNR